MKNRSIVIILIILSMLTACGQATPASNPGGTITPTPTSIPSYPGPTSSPSQPAPTTTHIPVDLTPAQMAAAQMVSKKYNIPINQIKITSTQAMTWPTGCLGVVIPGVLCTDLVTPGFLIKLEANGQQFEIHTNQDGSSVVDAAEQLGTLAFAVYASDRTIQVVHPNIALGPTYNPAFTGFLPAGGVITGTAYVLDFTDRARVVTVNGGGQQELSFIQNPTYGVAVWRGGLGTQPLLAWGTQPSGSDNSSSLMVANPDGSNLQTLLTILSPGVIPIQLVAELWSTDGQSLYFSKEPTGLGGYILFTGASNLYKIDIATKEVSEIIPQTSTDKPQTCLDAISGDYRYVADHCTMNAITVRDLQESTAATIQAPTDVTGYRLMGSARFSPSGDQVAFALAQGDPTDERGWVAIAPRTGGRATLLAASSGGEYYTVVGWLNDQTLLIQSNMIVCNPNCNSRLLTIGADGSNLTKVADGSLLAVIDNQ